MQSRERSHTEIDDYLRECRVKIKSVGKAFIKSYVLEIESWHSSIWIKVKDV